MIKTGELQFMSGTHYKYITRNARVNLNPAEFIWLHKDYFLIYDDIFSETWFLAKTPDKIVKIPLEDVTLAVIFDRKTNKITPIIKHNNSNVAALKFYLSQQLYDVRYEVPDFNTEAVKLLYPYTKHIKQGTELYYYPTLPHFGDGRFEIGEKYKVLLDYSDFFEWMIDIADKNNNSTKRHVGSFKSEFQIRREKLLELI